MQVGLGATSMDPVKVEESKEDEGVEQQSIYA